MRYLLLCCAFPLAVFWGVVAEPEIPVLPEVPEPVPVEQAAPPEPVAEAPVAAPVESPVPGTVPVLENAVGRATLWECRPSCREQRRRATLKTRVTALEEHSFASTD